MTIIEIQQMVKKLFKQWDLTVGLYPQVSVKLCSH